MLVTVLVLRAKDLHVKGLVTSLCTLFVTLKFLSNLKLFHRVFFTFSYQKIVKFRSLH